MPHAMLCTPRNDDGDSVPRRIQKIGVSPACASRAMATSPVCAEAMHADAAVHAQNEYADDDAAMYAAFAAYDCGDRSASAQLAYAVYARDEEHVPAALLLDILFHHEPAMVPHTVDSYALVDNCSAVYLDSPE